MRREFPTKIKLAAWALAKCKCERCSVQIRPGNGPHYDHRVPDAVNGEPTLANCQVLCKTCHGIKTAKVDVPAIAKTKRVLTGVARAERPKSRPMPGSRASAWKRRMDGTVVKR